MGDDREVGRATARERIALWVFLGFVLAALLGYGAFGRNPGWLAGLPAWAGAFYGTSFAFFAQAQVWLAGAVLAYVLLRRQRWAWLPALVLLYVLSLGAELAGTTFGIPFGAYRYGEALGPQWLGRVPVVIPLSWFTMAVPSYALARLVTGSGHGLLRAVIASLLLVSWDMSLDPAMSYVTRYWFWGEVGSYYGMPLVNLLGWFVTGLALMAGLALLRSERWIDTLPIRWLAGFYLVNLLLPLGMNAIAGLAGAVVAALAAGIVFLWFVRARRGSSASELGQLAGGVT